ncbi:hypothetical protein JCM10212_007062 [Sporobolomyces blumeae]
MSAPTRVDASRPLSPPTSPRSSSSPSSPSPTIYVHYADRHVKCRIDPEVPLDEIIRQLAASSQLAVSEPAHLFALRVQSTNQLVTEANLADVIHAHGTHLVLVSSPAMEAIDMIHHLSVLAPTTTTAATAATSRPGDEPSKRKKLALFELKSLVREPEFLVEFERRGGAELVERVVREEHGNTLAYGLLSVQTMLELDRARATRFEPRFVDRLLEIVATQPLINIARPAATILYLICASRVDLASPRLAAVASSPSPPSSSSTPDPSLGPASLSSAARHEPGFSLVFSLLPSHPKFLPQLINHISSPIERSGMADFELTRISLGLVDELVQGVSTMRSATGTDDKGFVAKLERLGLFEILIELFSSPDYSATSSTMPRSPLFASLVSFHETYLAYLWSRIRRDPFDPAHALHLVERAWGATGLARDVGSRERWTKVGWMTEDPVGEVRVEFERRSRIRREVEGRSDEGGNGNGDGNGNAQGIGVPLREGRGGNGKGKGKAERGDVEDVVRDGSDSAMFALRMFVEWCRDPENGYREHVDDSLSLARAHRVPFAHLSFSATEMMIELLELDRSPRVVVDQVARSTRRPSDPTTTTRKDATSDRSDGSTETRPSMTTRSSTQETTTTDPSSRPSTSSRSQRAGGPGETRNESSRVDRGLDRRLNPHVYELKELHEALMEFWIQMWVESGAEVALDEDRREEVHDDDDDDAGGLRPNRTDRGADVKAIKGEQGEEAWRSVVGADFERVERTVKSRVVEVLGLGAERGDGPRANAASNGTRGGCKSIRKIQEELAQSTYRVIRANQIEAFDLDQDLRSQPFVRHLRTTVYRESSEFVKRQKIDRLKRGFWFRVPASATPLRAPSRSRSRTRSSDSARRSVTNSVNGSVRSLSTVDTKTNGTAACRRDGKDDEEKENKRFGEHLGDPSEGTRWAFVRLSQGEEAFEYGTFDEPVDREGAVGPLAGILDLGSIIDICPTRAPVPGPASPPPATSPASNLLRPSTATTNGSKPDHGRASSSFRLSFAFRGHARRQSESTACPSSASNSVPSPSVVPPTTTCVVASPRSEPDLDPLSTSIYALRGTKLDDAEPVLTLVSTSRSAHLEWTDGISFLFPVSTSSSSGAIPARAERSGTTTVARPRPLKTGYRTSRDTIERIQKVTDVGVKIKLVDSGYSVRRRRERLHGQGLERGSGGPGSRAGPELSGRERDEVPRAKGENGWVVVAEEPAQGATKPHEDRDLVETLA